jgi:3D (Asp-Asp-Asp) domain-containing protein
MALNKVYCRRVSSKTVTAKQPREPLMNSVRKACVSGVMALLVALLGTGVEAKVSKNDPIKVFLVRATKYHRTDPGCDHWTLNGQTSTQLRLPQSDKVVTNPNTIGNVALDPDFVPEGSLVYETQTGKFFVSTTGGQAVIRRAAAIEFAEKKKLPREFRDALVFDFYYPKEIVNNHYTHCWVIPHVGETKFRNLRMVDQQQRLYASFWLKHLSKIYDSTSNEPEKQQLREMMNRLKLKDYQLVLR